MGLYLLPIGPTTDKMVLDDPLPIMFCNYRPLIINAKLIFQDDTVLLLRDGCYTIHHL